MFLVVLATVTGAAVAYLLRGGVPGLPSDLRARPALGLGLVGIAMAEWLPGLPGKPGFFLVGTVLVCAGLAQNLPFSGAFITAFGLALTGFVVLINGYLPLRADAAEAANIEATGLRQLEVDETRLGILGDVVPLPIGPWVVSFGDLIAAAGGFILGRSLMSERAEEGIDADEFLARFLDADDHDGDDDVIDLTRSDPPRIDLTDRFPARPTGEHAPRIDLTDRPPIERRIPPPTENDRFLGR